MRILIYNNNVKDLEQLSEMFKLFPIDTIIDKVSEYNDYVNIFQHHYYDKIFIDNNDDIGKKITKDILEKNPKQQIILINNHYGCLDKSQCKECMSNFNRKSIIHPINHNELSKIICDQYSCECFNKTEFEFKMQKIKKTLHNQYPYLKFSIDLQNEMILSEPMNPSILVALTELLEDNQLFYKVLDNQTIKIQQFYQAD